MSEVVVYNSHALASVYLLVGCKCQPIHGCWSNVRFNRMGDLLVSLLLDLCSRVSRPFFDRHECFFLTEFFPFASKVIVVAQRSSSFDGNVPCDGNRCI